MRLLSTRLSHLHRTPQASSRQIRHTSRYSNPTKRSFTAVPNQPSFFVNPESADNAAHGVQGGSARQHPTDPARNPLDARAVQIAALEKRQYHLHRMHYAGIGLLLTLLGLGGTLYNLDLDSMDRKDGAGKIRLDSSSEETKQFQGKEVHIIGAGEGKRIVAQGKGEEVELVETGTSSVPHFPRTVYLPTDSSGEAVAEIAQPNSSLNPGNVSNQEQYTLLGLGIRTVSFLSIQVYVVGLYVRTQDISALQEKLIHHVNPAASTLVPSEKEDLQKALLDPTTSGEIWTELLAVPGLKTAWRLSPTRNTDFMHLRDGWVTGINKRTAEAKSQLRLIPGAAESEYDSEVFGQSMRGFMNLFAGGKAPKGSVMILNRAQNGALDVFFQAKPDGKTGEEKAVQRLGRVEDERIGRLIWLNYLAGANVSSEAARKGVVDGCVQFAGRPVGSAETMVT